MSTKGPSRPKHTESGSGVTKHSTSGDKPTLRDMADAIALQYATSASMLYPWPVCIREDAKERLALAVMHMLTPIIASAVECAKSNSRADVDTRDITTALGYMDLKVQDLLGKTFITDSCPTRQVIEELIPMPVVTEGDK